MTCVAAWITWPPVVREYHIWGVWRAWLSVVGNPDEYDEAAVCPIGYIPVRCESSWLSMGPVGRVALCECGMGSVMVVILVLLTCASACVLFANTELWTWIVNAGLYLRWEYLRSVLLEVLKRCSAQPKVASRAVRSAFSSMPNVRTTPSKNHTHAASAASRSMASSGMTFLAQSIGADPFYYQQSPSDQKLGRSGSRSYYWAKDLGASPAPETTRDFCALVDVDYYVDMPELLARATGPVCLYTLVPKAAASSTGEFSFCFNENSEVEYRVSGGARYKHKIWDYGTDVIVAETTRWGFWHTSVAFNVDRRQVDDHHQMVLLTPIARLSCPFIRMTHLVEGESLKRLDVVETVFVEDTPEMFVRLNVQTKDGMYRSTGKVGMHVCATVPVAIDDGIQLQSCLNKMALSVAQVKTISGMDDTAAATVLTQYHRFASPRSAPTVHPVDKSVVTFCFEPKTYTGEEKPAMVAFMSPLVLGAMVPAITEANDTQSIRGRLEGVKSPEFELSGPIVGYMSEFSERFIPQHLVHSAYPRDQDEIYARQNRPAQVRILDEGAAIGGLVDQPVSSFMKRESYAKVTDPRNISQIPHANKLKYSSYIYAFSDHLRTMAWYAFGKTPREISSRVAVLCLRASRSVTKTDLSRCDGRISNLFRHLEKMCMLRLFATACHDDLLKAMETQHSQRAFTATGYAYETGFSRLSGSPETADFNSLDNCFIAYCTYRKMGYSADEAWAKVVSGGVYGGDDGLSSDIDSGLYEQMARDLGQVLEAEVVPKHSRGVDFLSRLYSQRVWCGDASSMCDVKRQLLKLHLTGSLPVSITAVDKLREKMRGFSLTDPNTPIIGLIAAKVARVCGRVGKRDDMPGVASYFSKYDGEDEQYPNENPDGWMDDEVELQMPDFDWGKFVDWVEACKRPEDLLSPPVCADCTARVEPPADVVVNEDIVRVKSPPQPPRPAGKVCEYYRAGKCTFGLKCRDLHEGDVVQDKAVCLDYQRKGECRFGDKCKWPHVKRASAPNGGAR